MAQNWIVRYNKTGYQLSLFPANHLPCNRRRKSKKMFSVNANVF